MTCAFRPIEFAGGCLGRERHVCAFFNSADEEYRTFLPFIKEGLDQGERALHIVNPNLKTDHVNRLKQAGIDTDAATARGQLDVRPWEEGHLQGNKFDQDAMLALVEQILEDGVQRNLPLSRIIGHMDWATLKRPEVEDLAEYESRLNYIIPKYDSPIVCTYDLAKFGARLAFDILRTHPMVIVGGVLQENPFYVPPDEFLLELRERRSGKRAVALN